MPTMDPERQSRRLQLNQHDLDGIMTTFGATPRYDDEPWNAHYTGRDGVRSFYSELLRAMPDLQSALYFSANTYTTTGYGDLVLPNEWRLVGGVEALTGILMCGWSTGFFFAVVSQLFGAKAKPVDPTP